MDISVIISKETNKLNITLQIMNAHHFYRDSFKKHLQSSLSAYLYVQCDYDVEEQYEKCVATTLTIPADNPLAAVELLLEFERYLKDPGVPRYPVSGGEKQGLYANFSYTLRIGSAATQYLKGPLSLNVATQIGNEIAILGGSLASLKALALTNQDRALTTDMRRALIQELNTMIEHNAMTKEELYEILQCITKFNRVNFIESCSFSHKNNMRLLNARFELETDGRLSYDLSNNHITSDADSVSNYKAFFADIGAIHDDLEPARKTDRITFTKESSDQLLNQGLALYNEFFTKDELIALNKAKNVDSTEEVEKAGEEINQEDDVYSTLNEEEFEVCSPLKFAATEGTLLFKAKEINKAEQNNDIDVVVDNKVASKM